MEKSSLPTLTVTEVTARIKRLLESDPALSGVWIKGEISNLTRHGSGHLYFSIKDEQAAISCVMFRREAAAYYAQLPKHGEKVLVKGRVTVYPPHGKYQFVVSAIKKDGLGDLHRKFEELKIKLKSEGLFDPEHKKPLPQFPKVIGVATSPTGAVFQDILNSIRRRWPHVKVLLVPTAVQGEYAKDSIVRSLKLLNSHAEVDVIILGRGGGSLEDLWSFNEEAVARAIFESRLPVISSVGHQTDFTIADFVADRRASTPTEAAEFAVPNADDFRYTLDSWERQMKRNLQHYIDINGQKLDDLSRRLIRNAEGFVREKRIELERAENRMQRTMLHNIDSRRQLLQEYQFRMEQGLKNSFEGVRQELKVLEVKLDSLNVNKILNAGYTLTLKEDKLVKDATELEAGDTLHTYFAKGKSVSTVDRTEEI